MTDAARRKTGALPPAVQPSTAGLDAKPPLGDVHVPRIQFDPEPVAAMSLRDGADGAGPEGVRLGWRRCERGQTPMLLFAPSGSS